MQWWIALITFLYVDFLDTTGTLFSMANFMNNFIPGERPQLPSPAPVPNCSPGSARARGHIMGLLSAKPPTQHFSDRIFPSGAFKCRGKSPWPPLGAGWPRMHPPSWCGFKQVKP